MSDLDEQRPAPYRWRGIPWYLETRVIVAGSFLAGAIVGAGVLFGLMSLDGDDAASSSKFRSAEDIVDAIGCTEYVTGSEEIFVTEGGTCQLDGQAVTIAWFRTDALQQSWTDIADQFAGDLVLAGDGWTTYGPDRATLERIQSNLGGEIS